MTAVKEKFNSRPLVINEGLYDAFMKQGKIGNDLISLYLLMIKTSNNQETNTIYCTDTYIKKNTHLSNKRIKEAKSLLHKMGLIQFIHRRSEAGQFSKTYIHIIWSSKLETLEKKIEEAESYNEDKENKVVEIKTLDNRRVKTRPHRKHKHTYSNKINAYNKRRVITLNNNHTKVFGQLGSLYYQKYKQSLPDIKNRGLLNSILSSNDHNSVISCFKNYLIDDSGYLSRAKHHPNIWLKQFESYNITIKKRKEYDLTEKHQYDHKVEEEFQDKEITTDNQKCFDNFWERCNIRKREK